MVPLILLCLSQDADQAVVTLSNGERADGAFSLTEGRKLELFDVKKSKRFKIDGPEIVRIGVVVEEEKLEQGWMFKEESDHTKVKLPFKYPLRKLMTDVTLRTGETMRGHVVCVFYLDKDDERRRFLLLTDQKGEKDQKLEDLLYVKEIVFPNRKAGDAKLGTIKVSGAAAAVSLEREMSFQPPLTGLLSGRYDVYLFGEKKVRYGLTGEGVKEEERKAVEEKVAKIEEFFTRKRIVAIARDGEILRALVELTRTEESHDKGWRYARWEVWTFEATKLSWDVRKRLYLHRLRVAADKGLPEFEYVADAKLKGVSENAVIE